MHAYLGQALLSSWARLGCLPSPTPVTYANMAGLLSRIDLERLDGVSSEAKGCAVMAAVGVASHLLYFIRGDHNRYAHRWITRALTGITALALVVLYLEK